jgi:outer membrane protein TolC
VEDNLAALAAYRDAHGDLATSADAATHAEVIARNEYRAGTVDYTTVAVAQATAASARQAEITNVVNRQGAAVSLIAAIGGEWMGTGG